MTAHAAPRPTASRACAPAVPGPAASAPPGRPDTGPPPREPVLDVPAGAGPRAQAPTGAGAHAPAAVGAGPHAHPRRGTEPVTRAVAGPEPPVRPPARAAARRPPPAGAHRVHRPAAAGVPLPAYGTVEAAHRAHAPAGPRGCPPLKAVLFDRDGTLVQDVPYNGDPGKVRPMRGAVAGVRLARAAGLVTGVVSNQSGVGRGLLTEADVRRVNARVDEVFGPFAVWEVCPHAPGAGCGCRKPAPGLVLAAARRLGVDPRECAVIGDIGADLGAARAAGARGVIVPTPVTRPEEYLAEPDTAPDVLTAVRRLLAPRTGPDRRRPR